MGDGRMDLVARRARVVRLGERVADPCLWEGLVPLFGDACAARGRKASELASGAPRLERGQVRHGRSTKSEGKGCNDAYCFVGYETFDAVWDRSSVLRLTSGDRWLVGRVRRASSRSSHWRQRGVRSNRGCENNHAAGIHDSTPYSNISNRVTCLSFPVSTHRQRMKLLLSKH
ncbi:unnamed protein product [Mycena citricolor]|uniref:Uncharacterized protein n=1 Tax=Mycena citricolor TaxID=2018698 RepID=A0AAD2HJK9_9AGAR|nr:unnamed protein product [Mycena citricolor]CAK5277032.1 unnamed protein product [Mycena citricolor]CAK5277042.1 unnamed protein product [Mycena citricolor]